MDLTSLKSVREFVRMFKDRGLPLHVLVNNGGIFLCHSKCIKCHIDITFLQIC